MGGWDGEERRRNPTDHEVLRRVEDTGLKIRSFGDIYHAMSIAVVMIAGVAWGLKLEARIEAAQRDQTEIRAQLSKGILPLAEERLNSLAGRLDRREQEGDRALVMIKEVQKECQQVLRGK